MAHGGHIAPEGAPIRARPVPARPGTGGHWTGANWCPLRRNVASMSHMPSEPDPQARWTPLLVHELTSGALATPAAANRLVQHRIPVFPCVPGEKRPLTAHGFQDATSDPATVASWWSRWPTANIGIPTGAASGIDVVDVDVHPGGSGFQGFDRARRSDLVTGWAWMLRTPSGGLHAYFLRWGEDEQRSWQLPGKHVDFRGDGGYVVAPPSRVIGRDGVERGYEPVSYTHLRAH